MNDFIVNDRQVELLWAGLGEKRKFHLVNWGDVCSPITVGVLD